MGLGTMFGGWRIVKTMGNRITKLNQARGFCANSGGAITLFMATALGIPVSTTHTITGAIAGVGSTRGARRVRWGVAGGIVWAWILTIPCSAAMAALAWYVGHLSLIRRRLQAGMSGTSSASSSRMRSRGQLAFLDAENQQVVGRRIQDQVRNDLIEVAMFDLQCLKLVADAIQFFIGQGLRGHGLFLTACDVIARITRT
jgi:hypothetical protein